MSVSKHVVNIYLMQSPNQNLPLSKEEGIWKRKIGVQNKFSNCQLPFPSHNLTIIETKIT
jgi:hypothetical protein